MNVIIMVAVASVAGADLPLQVVLITGVAKLIGDALSMAIGRQRYLP